MDVPGRENEGVRTRLNRRSRNDDVLSEEEDAPSALFSNKGHALGVGNGEAITLDQDSVAQAHVYVLHNYDEVADYIKEHEIEVNNNRGSNGKKQNSITKPSLSGLKGV
ncbi:hypothetical protein PIB30_073898, partial [Stylosanthes scabra]|nr:hypothetical protein [Stylosanthes scabra]